MKKRHLLAVGPWYHASASRYFVDAFERLGWIVTRVGPEYMDHAKEYNVSWGKDFPLIDIPLLRQSSWYIDDIVSQATKIQGISPDLCIIIEESYNNEIINTKKIPSVLISLDGWPNSYLRKDTIQATASFTNHPLGIIAHPLNETPAGWEWLPGGCAPWCHINKFKPIEQRSIDFCLLATPYGLRQQLCDALRLAGLRVKDGIVGTREFVESYNDSAITYHNANTQNEWKWRWGEGSAMGVVHIADFTKVYSWLGFQAYAHYIPVDLDPTTHWPDVDNFVRVVREARNNNKLLQSISTKAWYLTLSRHTYYHRAYKIMTSVGIDPQISLDEIRNLSLRENGGVGLGE